MKTAFVRAFRWVIDGLSDPVSEDMSTARMVGVGLFGLAAFVTMWGLLNGVDPKGIAAIDAALVGPGAVALLSRKKTGEP